MDARDIDALARQLSDIYHPLELKAFHLYQGLQHRIFDPRLSYYSGHSRISADGSRRIDWYPLPVVTLDGLCDVVVDLDRVVVDAKLHREAASTLPFEQFEKYEFYICGAYDDIIYHHRADADTAPAREAAIASGEKLLSFSFHLDFEIDGDSMYEFAKLIRRRGFCD